MTAEIHTEKGLMKVSFYNDDAPNTVKNFIDLAQKGFYDGLTFHRVIPDFVMETTNITILVYCQWHMLEEILGDHNFLSAIVVIIPLILIGTILVLVK